MATVSGVVLLFPPGADRDINTLDVRHGLLRQATDVPIGDGSDGGAAAAAGGGPSSLLVTVELKLTWLWGGRTPPDEDLDRGAGDFRIPEEDLAMPPPDGAGPDVMKISDEDLTTPQDERGVADAFGDEVRDVAFVLKETKR